MKVCVVVVNWNGWADTLECLESLLRCEPGGFTVVVCDNGSGDGSAQRIRDWAEGRLEVAVHPGSPLRPLSFPPLPKPVPYVEYGRAEAERGGGPADPALVLVSTEENLGFAGGNNVGIRYALARGGFDYLWLLNNDTVVRPDALRKLVEEAERNPEAGIIGSTLLYYDRPDTVQTLGGGTYNWWLGLPRHIGADSAADGAPRGPRPEMSYVVGASMLVRASFVREVGLLSEEYFLYFEELDWAARARGRYTLGYAPDSVVYHREGSSTGGKASGVKSRVADYHFYRNRVRFTRKFAPALLPAVHLSLLFPIARRAGRGQWDHVRMLAKLWFTA
ncbi:MAG TPA: glycosyltransferase family 2 protein [Longimicrobium sp.]